MNGREGWACSIAVLFYFARGSNLVKKGVFDSYAGKRATK